MNFRAYAAAPKQTPCQTSGFLAFDTALGRCGLLWGPAGVRAVALGDDVATLERRWREAGPPCAAPPAVLALRERIQRHLEGELDAFADVALDLSGVSAFDQQVLAAARRIPPGETLTYGELARRVGRPGGARAVGGAMGRNPLPIVVPCHRIVRAGGALGGYSAPGGLDTKERLLELEGALAAC